MAGEMLCLIYQLDREGKLDNQEDESMKLSEMVEEAQKNLDQFNLEVAQFRLRNGMSQELIHLYAEMGRLSTMLVELRNETLLVERQDDTVAQLFDRLKEAYSERKGTSGR